MEMFHIINRINAYDSIVAAVIFTLILHGNDNLSPCTVS